MVPRRRRDAADAAVMLQMERCEWCRHAPQFLPRRRRDAADAAVMLQMDASGAAIRRNSCPDAAAMVQMECRE